MDFETERSIRLYVRNTETWRAIGWQGRTTLVMMLRAVDAAGCIEFDPADRDNSLAAATMLPRDVVAVGLAKLLKHGVVVELQPGRLNFPRFKAANPQSSLTESLLEGQRALLAEQKARSQARFERPPVDEAPPDVPKPPPPLAIAIQESYARRYASQRNGEVCTLQYSASVKLAEWCEKNALPFQCLPRALAERVLDGLFADARSAARLWPLNFAAHSPAQYAGPMAAAKPMLKAVPSKPVYAPGAISPRESIVAAAGANPDWVTAV
jgi:hypothetical protein